MAQTEKNCGICGNTAGNKSFIARELAHGMHDEFEYIECGACGCLQIAETPADLSRYYPSDYYSFAKRKGRFNLPKLLRYAWRMTRQGNLLGILKRARRMTAPSEHDVILQSGAARLDSRILDVGCGSGELVHQMALAGFTNLTGIDPFLGGNPFQHPAIRVLKKSVFEIEGVFDFIMLHHSFEHMENPREVLGRLHELLADDGTLLIRVPVAGSYAWRTYGVNWVQLDAPRHLFLHTPQSMRLLAAQAGFAVEEVTYDSNDSQFWGSEQNLRGIPLWSPQSYSTNPGASIFTEKRIEAYVRHAAELNAVGDGDTARFILRKTSAAA